MTRDANRQVPVPTAIKTVFGRARTYLGYGVFSFLMVFAWVFGGNSDANFYRYWGELTPTTGIIVKVVETNTEINEETVWANVYEYTDDAGYTYVRDAFTTGWSFSVAETVKVKYVTDSPEFAQVEGASNSFFGSWALLFYLPPMIGIFFIKSGISQGLIDLQLLKNGKIVKSKLVDKKPTSVVINDRTVYEMQFEYSSGKDKHRRTLSTSHPEKFEDDVHEYLIFDPNQPEKAQLVDDLSANVSVTKNGGLKLGSSLSIAVFLMPLILVGPHLWYLISLF
ncbi:MAG: hypothetical protein ACPGR2_01480 [Psychrobium sp.]